MKKRHVITVYEHEVLRIGEGRLSRKQLESLQRHYGNSVPYFNLVHDGVKFKEYVGVIQEGQTVIEVLPKADRAREPSEAMETKWRKVLIGMLKVVGAFQVRSTSQSDLTLQSNHILDLYFELFIREVEGLLHQGLVKQYRKTEGNRTALKGALVFSKHLQQNLVHQERFYTRHYVYDIQHLIHAILYKAICLLKQINTNINLHSRIGVLLLHFPPMPDIRVDDATFERITYTRKTRNYESAISIARLLLLNYHPDLSAGRNDVLALMFDMNLLWEQFLFASLRKHLTGNYIVTAQTTKPFWKPDSGYTSSMKPDIWIRRGEESFILDTKWKHIQGYNPSPDDLRQLYVYHEYYKARKVALVYPGETSNSRQGKYYEPHSNTLGNKHCSVLCFTPNGDVIEWQAEIAKRITKWVTFLYSPIDSDRP
ncbi:McrC family protein [Parapedobacter koreensis]|uniref:5-methylcytosine-specific restriction enzyme subunit McrC n=1 Tax=Parapedobacter koreensis TaxID=332977 RepID=A0A1H7UMD2_9SPHI|nr:restriction endonuclease [Parapedobacter koreensis]SEL97966.1 5-methylcytosine-specific restriction enzyme subunit McrC [Parapedobacter koreensis]